MTSHTEMMRDDAPVAAAEPDLLTPHELAAQREIAIVDVRPAEERLGELGFVPGSRSFGHVATDDLAEVLLAEYGARSALAVVCLSGKRSLPVSQRLHEAGLGDVAHLEGGILAWQAAGLPLCGVRSVPEEELVALQGAREFPRAVLSCFVAESVEAQLNAGADSLADPRKLVEEVFDTGPPEDPEHLLHCLDRLAEQARRAGHPLSHIATNVDRLRASLLAVGG